MRIATLSHRELEAGYFSVELSQLKGHGFFFYMPSGRLGMWSLPHTFINTGWVFWSVSHWLILLPMNVSWYPI